MLDPLHVSVVIEIRTLDSLHSAVDIEIGIADSLHDTAVIKNRILDPHIRRIRCIRRGAVVALIDKISCSIGATAAPLQR